MTTQIRAILLAAGLGTRLRPLTKNVPKCLVHVGGKPLIARWLETLETLGCEAVLVNTHYLSSQVDKFLEDRANTHMLVDTVHEDKLKGTAGTLIANLGFFKEATGLLIHADNATDVDLSGLLEAHIRRPQGCLITMLTFKTDNPKSCGIVQTNDSGIVTSFHEKVDSPPGNIANAAIYAFDNDFLEFLVAMDSDVSDFSIDVIPRLLGRINTFHTSSTLIDIGTPEALQKARSIWPSNRGETHCDK